MELNWQLLTWIDLDKRLLYDILRLRSEVFVVEQTCVYQDIDDKDQTSIHLVGSFQNELLAYARIVPANDSKRVSIGRVLIALPARGKQIGHQLMEQCLLGAKRHFPNEKLQLSAQKHLTAFYSKHGFRVKGDPYLEDGIPHVLMQN